MSGNPAFRPAVDALNQLRGIVSLGLGINVDRDLLPLFDGEAAVALRALTADGPRGQLLLRPADAAAAADALRRMTAALVARGSLLSTRQVGGTTLTSVAIPGIGDVAYAMRGGVVLLGLDPDDVAAALQANAAGTTLADDGRYASPFGLAGTRAGDEVWADVPSVVEAVNTILDPGGEVRDILHQIGELAISAAGHDDRLEINGVLTVP